MSLSTEQVNTFAALGAKMRLAELEKEREALLAYVNGADKTDWPALIKTPRRGGSARKRKGMTAAQRKAVGVRMRKYWAARRRAEA